MGLKSKPRTMQWK